jgi:pilus assembly protein CpaE
LSKPVTAERLVEAFSRFQERQALAPVAAYMSGKVITICGVKGGTGATTLSVHLAMTLQKKFNKNVLLLDHHSQLGHICLHLGIKPGPYHFDELCRNADRLDAELLRGFVVRHSSGVEAISSPDTCSIMKFGHATDSLKVLNFLRRSYDYVIVDTSVHEDDLTPQSDEIYIVATPDVAAVRDAARYQDRFRTHEALARRVRIVLNRADITQGLPVESVEDTLACSVIQVPNHASELLRAVNAGEPLDPGRRSDFSSAIMKWAEAIAGPSVQSPAEKKNKFPLWRLAGATR